MGTEWCLKVRLWHMNGDLKEDTYGTLQIGGDAEDYLLDVGSCDGAGSTAGCCLVNFGASTNKFSAKDDDNDQLIGSCANNYDSGWWFGACHDCNLFAPWYGPTQAQYDDVVSYDRKGVTWRTWAGPTGKHYRGVRGG